MSGTTTEVVPTITTPAPVVAQPSTLIPDPAAPRVVTDPAKPAVSAEGKPVEAPKAPEKYEFKLPEGVTIDAPLMDEFTTLAKATNLPQQQADAFLAIGLKLQEAIVARTVEQQLALHAQWANEAASDPEIGGAKYDDNIVLARQVMAQFGQDPELEADLLTTGMQAKKSFLSFLLRIQKATGEDKGGGVSTISAVPMRPADAMFGQTTNKQP